MPKYTKEHCEAVGARIMEYDEAIAANGFVRLESCCVCDTVERCSINCLLDDCSYGPVDYGACCRTKKHQALRRNWLISLVEERGYSIVEVDA